VAGKEDWSLDALADMDVLLSDVIVDMPEQPLRVAARQQRVMDLVIRFFSGMDFT
jgi:hypothetical protein